MMPGRRSCAANPRTPADHSSGISDVPRHILSHSIDPNNGDDAPVGERQSQSDAFDPRSAQQGRAPLPENPPGNGEQIRKNRWPKRYGIVRNQWSGAYRTNCPRFPCLKCIPIRYLAVPPSIRTPAQHRQIRKPAGSASLGQFRHWPRLRHSPGCLSAIGYEGIGRNPSTDINPTSRFRAPT